MRLNKFMSSCGVASRRRCDEIISEGRVRVNAVVVKKMGIKINPETDIVAVDGRPIRLKGDLVYYMMNKPVGYITSVKDPQGRKTVMELLPAINKRVYPVGRLDYNTSGLLLFTNDGEITQKLMHPSFEFGKTYMVVIKGDITEQELQKLRDGVDIGDFVTSKAEVKKISNLNNQSSIQITIHEGKNRQVRRMFKAINKSIVELSRIALGKLTLKGLKVGEVRELSEEEINYLNSL